MKVSFATQREDFPPNMTDLRIERVTLYIALKSGVTQEINTLDLHFTEQDKHGDVGGPKNVINGIAKWMAMNGRSPFGNWTLAFEDEPEFRDLFANDQIEDILFVITFGGEMPPWSATG